MGRHKKIDLKPIFEGGEYRVLECGKKQLVSNLHWKIPGRDLKYEEGVVPAGFKSDGCTCWPDRMFFFMKKDRTKQCFMHDYICRHLIETYADRFEADRALRYGVGSIDGAVMYLGVRSYSISLALRGKVRSDSH